MTKQETIQVLQSIEDRAVDFPNMTACDWVAIAAAKRHLENSLDEVKEVESEKAALKAKINQMIREIDQMGTYLSPKGVLVNLLCHIDTPELGT